MKFLHIVNQPATTWEVTGSTGYAVSINYLVAELRQQGHASNFYSIPWFRDDHHALYGHSVLHDTGMGRSLYVACTMYDIVIVHATTPVPESFVQECQNPDKPFRLITIVHDPVFCNATYGYNVESNCTVPMSRWSEDYLFKDSAHIAEIIQTYAPAIIHMDDVYRMYKVYLDLFNCSMTICPSPQVVSLMDMHGVMPSRRRFVPHAIPETLFHHPRSDRQVVSVLTWYKVDYRTTIDVARNMPDKHFHLVCSDFMGNKLCQYGLPANVNLASVMSRNEFFQYIDRHRIGLCLHLSCVFETFALLPYEMAQLGVRTTMCDNGSGLTEAIRYNNLNDCSVGLDYTTDAVIAALNRPLAAWHQAGIRPPMRIADYAQTLINQTPDANVEPQP